MRLMLDSESGELEVDGRRLNLWSREGFEALSKAWLKVGWNEKYTYTFSWLGRPVIQLPEDLVRLQEVLWHVRPDVIVETGIAHGGSLVFHASMCRLAGMGRVIGVDVEIRPHNRKAIETHELIDLITLVEGDSTASDIVEQVRSLISPSESCLVILDSAHSRNHVRAELEAYAPLVTPGSYIVVADGIMADVTDAPRGSRDWDRDNPSQAAVEFLRSHPEFSSEPPKWAFNESPLHAPVTYWPDGWLRRSE